MIKAPTGESQNVTGRIMAMVVSGPIPGRTPMAVPMTQPKKHRAMLCQVSAMPNPMMMLDKTSGMSEGRRPQRDGNSQGENENTDIGSNQDKAQQQQREDAQVWLGEPRKQDDDGQRENHSKRMQEERKSNARQGDKHERPPPARVRTLERR